MGVEPITFPMSRGYSTDKLRDYFLLSLHFTADKIRTCVSPFAEEFLATRTRHHILRTRRDSNPWWAFAYRFAVCCVRHSTTCSFCTRREIRTLTLLYSLPCLKRKCLPFQHSGRYKFLLMWRVTIPLPRRYQLRALTIWATHQFLRPRWDSNPHSHPLPFSRFEDEVDTRPF